MMKLIWILFWLVMIVAGMTLLASSFMNDSIAGQCGDKLIGCLENTSHLSWWKKMVAALQCVGSNVVCVFKQIGASF